MADWVVRLLDAANGKGERGGPPWGSLVAWSARRATRAIESRVLGIAYPMKVTAFPAGGEGEPPDAYDMETIWSHAAQVPLGGNPNPGMWMYGEDLARLGRLAPGVLHNDLTACHTYGGGEAAAAKLQCPVLFVLGRRDQMTPAKAGAAFARTVPNARLVQLEASGHSLMTEAPDATLDALIDFFGA
jgi:pimeloyl-ACP methyl ester carboxylesterase